jgi:hypothetical protein
LPVCSKEKELVPLFTLARVYSTYSSVVADEIASAVIPYEIQISLTRVAHRIIARNLDNTSIVNRELGIVADIFRERSLLRDQSAGVLLTV